jgi:drug/metabolite transporter (DMT)-like permease
VIAALGGVIFLEEPATLRLAVASAAILGGIVLVIRRNKMQPAPDKLTQPKATRPFFIC